MNYDWRLTPDTNFLGISECSGEGISPVPDPDSFLAGDIFLDSCKVDGVTLSSSIPEDYWSLREGYRWFCCERLDISCLPALLPAYELLGLEAVPSFIRAETFCDSYCESNFSCLMFSKSRVRCSLLLESLFWKLLIFTLLDSMLAPYVCSWTFSALITYGILRTGMNEFVAPFYSAF